MGDFRALHVERSATLRVEAPPERAFRLFEPLGEREWVEGWDPRMLHPPTGEARVGTAFTTGEGAERTLWLVVEHDPEALRVAYARVTPASRIGMVTVQAAAQRDGATLVEVGYVFTALNEAGNEYLEGFTEAYFHDYIRSWEEAIGTALRRPASESAPRPPEERPAPAE